MTMAHQNRGRARSTNQPSKLLSNSENQQLFQVIGNNCQTLASAVVQVFLADPPNAFKWTKWCCGVATFVKDNPNRSYYIRVYNLSSGSKIWEQELYSHFQYNSPRRFFHTFDTDDCQAGLNFANEDEANKFKAVVTDKINQRAQRRKERKQNSINPNKRKAPPSPSPGGIKTSLNATDTRNSRTTKSTKEKKGKKGKLTKGDIGTPKDFRHVGHVGWDPDKANLDTRNLDPSLKALFDQVGISEEQLQDKETADFIYDFIDQHGGIAAVKRSHQTRANAPLPPVPPGSGGGRSGPLPPPPPSPTSTGGLPPPLPPSRITGRPQAAPPPPPPSRGPPPTPSVISSSTSSTMSPPIPRKNYHAPPPPSQKRSMSPPPPPPPPPPGPPPPPSSSGAPSTVGFPPDPPPPPPPPPPPGAPPPPSPGPSEYGGGRSDLLSAIQGGAQLRHLTDDDLTRDTGTGDGKDQLNADIRKGIQLKKVDPAERSRSDDVEADSGLASALARALASRAVVVQESDSDSAEDEDSESEWD